MERAEAIQRLRSLVGQDLVAVARRFGVTVWKGGRKNKGWAGHAVERYLGLPLNSTQAPDFGEWELKVVPLERRGGIVSVKETMAITMIQEADVPNRTFQDSHLFAKLRRMIVVARMFESQREERSLCHRIAEFDLGEQELRRQIEADYNYVQEVIRTKGFAALSGYMGDLVQPRTKGPGHGSQSRAFYARKQLVARILGI